MEFRRVAEMEDEIRKLWMNNELLKKISGLLRQATAANMRCCWIEAEKVN